MCGHPSHWVHLIVFRKDVFLESFNTNKGTLINLIILVKITFLFVGVTA